MNHISITKIVYSWFLMSSMAQTENKNGNNKCHYYSSYYELKVLIGHRRHLVFLIHVKKHQNLAVRQLYTL